ncbi:ADP ribosylation factor like GTPase 3, like 1 isoform X1 [Acanthopagrus latus]|uniref:ADP ribosylation factor like GTPase 3, like 1 isoform X1 n=1 Tax=Acanthopagrus latus TaxID=8177 RepID=UPI00187C0406|nr:ADP ribosylation factor like GTPase 3, like 1 isoform X1 [Acanthopagrus latus]
MREIPLYVLLGHLLIAAVGSVCVPVQCLKCNIKGQTLADSCPLCNTTAQCFNVTTSNCTKDFKVFVNSSGSVANAGEEITLTCCHDLPNLNLMFEWTKDKNKIEERGNGSKLVLQKVTLRQSGKYSCSVTSLCGTFKSLPHDVTVNDNSVVILVVCGVGALVLVVIMGMAMKFKLKRDNVKHKERMRQRAQAAQSSSPAPITPRDS